MKAEEEKNERLIRWLEGDLSGEELTAFESSPEFEDYKKILDASEDLSYPKMDEKAAFDQIQHKISTKQNKPKIINMRRWMLAVASILVISFAVVSILPKSINVRSEKGQYVTVTLPDQSLINLNGNSSIDYHKDFLSNRTVELKGEAFFRVEKGKTFTVNTPNGNVTVLGTSFNVFSRDEVMVVSCKTGKVKVESGTHTAILDPGNEIRFVQKTTSGKESISTDKIATWIDGESYFSRSTLQEVALSLSSVYNVNIKLPSDFQKKKFTGSFVHNDFNKALKMVFSPMDIQYSVDDNGEVVFSD